MADDTLWTLADVAHYLKMNERTVAKLAASGVMPGAKIASQWRFKPSLIEEWLIQQIKNLSPEEVEQRSLDKKPQPIEVAGLFHPAACLLNLNASRREEALRALAEAMGAAGLIRETDDFISAVLHREYLCSTGIGDGIALPHARHSSERFCAVAGVGLGRCPQGIDFDAMDGRPVYLIFLIGAPDDTTHLRIMAQLARLFREGELREELMSASAPEAAIRAIARREQRLAAMQLAS